MLWLLAAFLTISSAVATPVSTVLPELHVIKEYAFRYPYSCQPSPIGYKYSALFLTDYDMSRNDPALLYNGACGSQDYFEVMMAGDDFGLISDLGDVPLENVTASRAFNYQRVSGMDNIFSQTVPAIAGHTYAALLARQDLRALFVFRVDSFRQDGPAAIRYAVKQYGIVTVVQEDPGFSWDEPNH